MKVFLLTYLFVSSFYVLFSAYATWHRIQREGKLDWHHWFFLGPWAIVGYLEDLLFNLTFGTVMYFETPWTGADTWKFWEWTFTGHTKRWASPTPPWSVFPILGRWRARVALWWKNFINTIEPGHV